MLNRVKAKFDLHPERLIAVTAYGTGPLLGWLVAGCETEVIGIMS